MISIADIEQAIIDIFDVHLALRGYDKNVFVIATIGQVAQYLGVKPHAINWTLREQAGPYRGVDYYTWKQKVLVKYGRGRMASSPVSTRCHHCGQLLPNKQNPVTWFEPIIAKEQP